jgi:hypothetical protein
VISAVCQPTVRYALYLGGRDASERHVFDVGDERACGVRAAVPSSFTWLFSVSRILGAAGIVAGAILIGFNPDRWDVVVATLPRGHGIHVRDLVGMMFIAAGILVLWHAPSRR